MIYPVPLPKITRFDSWQQVGEAVLQILETLIATPRWEIKHVELVCVAGNSVRLATSLTKVHGVHLLRCRRERDATEDVTFGALVQWRHETDGVYVDLDPGDASELKHLMTFVIWGE